MVLVNVKRYHQKIVTLTMYPTDGPEDHRMFSTGRDFGYHPWGWLLSHPWKKLGPPNLLMRHHQDVFYLVVCAVH